MLGAIWTFRSYRPWPFYLASVVAAIGAIDTASPTDWIPGSRWPGAGLVIGFWGIVWLLIHVRDRLRLAAERRQRVYAEKGDVVEWRLAETAVRSGLDREGLQRLVEANLKRQGRPESNITEYTRELLRKRDLLISQPDLDWRSQVTPLESELSAADARENAANRDFIIAAAFVLIFLAVSGLEIYVW